MNENEVLFELKNVICSYSESAGKAVLKIDHLQIPRGKVIFLLGASGTGKSTLLETLGLMNHTLFSGSLFFYPDQDTKNYIDYKSLWDSGTDVKISETRKQFFSFVFQNTNLMSNFSAYENVSISGLIDNTRPREETLADAVSLMEKVKLPFSAVSYNTQVFNLSGGQRQRLSFVRALAKNPKVLFCDEPTGNLDEANAREVFEIISSVSKNNFSSIIVSHDINLALRYADLIFMITKNKDKDHGEILKENIFSRSTWEGFDPAQLLLFRNRIASFFVHPEDSKLVEAETPQAKSDFKLKSFNALFYLKEGKSLLGKYFVNFWILLLLLSVSLLAIGFANGSLSYLDKKMHDPFVDWIPLKVPFERGGEESIKKDLRQIENDSLKKRFIYSTVSVFTEQHFYVMDFKDKNISLSSEVKGRSIDVNKDRSLLVEHILGGENFIAGNRSGFIGEKDLSVIVRKSFLESLHYPRDAEYIYIEQSFTDSMGSKVDLFIPVPIRAIVKEVPGKNDILFTAYFYNAWNQAEDDAFDIRTKLNTIIFYLKGEKAKAVKVLDFIKEAFSSNPNLSKYSAFQPEFSLNEHVQSFGQGFDFMVRFFYPLETKREMDAVTAKISSEVINKFPNLNATVIYYYDQVNERFEPIVYDGMSIYFGKLDSVRGMNNYIIKNLNERSSRGKIEMDESQIKEKENFNFLNNITLAVSYLIIVFGCLALSIFIFNLLRNHLQKVTMNIGTFKAMGLSNTRSLTIYFLIITVFIFSGIILSFLLVGGLGTFINIALMYILNVEGNVEYFKLIDPKTFWSLIIFSVVSLLVSWITIKKILSKTPGDLIYNRG